MLVRDSNLVEGSSLVVNYVNLTTPNIYIIKNNIAIDL